MSVAATNALGAIDSNRARRRPCDGGGRPAAAARDRRRRRARARAARAPAGNPATKLILRHAEHETVAIQDLARELVGERATVVASGSEAVEVTAAGVNKATAVAELGVPPEQVVAFGDFPNDIPLLTWAGHGVAMGNAHPDVVAIADEVTATNDEDGVALVLERLVRA